MRLTSEFIHEYKDGIDKNTVHICGRPCHMYKTKNGDTIICVLEANMALKFNGLGHLTGILNHYLGTSPMNTILGTEIDDYDTVYCLLFAMESYGFIEAFDHSKGDISQIDVIKLDRDIDGRIVK